MSYLEGLFSLRGKNALVTGAASGLGRHCAVVLAQAGARVAVVDIDPAGLVETAKTISQSIALEGDVMQSDGVERMVTDAVEALGQIDIAVTCAGVALWKPALEVSEQEFDRVFDVDVKGTWSPRRSPGTWCPVASAAVSSPSRRPIRTVPRRTWLPIAAQKRR